MPANILAGISYIVLSKTKQRYSTLLVFLLHCLERYFSGVSLNLSRQYAEQKAYTRFL
jgi:hypothetical protein